MKLDLDLTEQDYIDFNLDYFDTSPAMRSSHNKSRFAGTLMFFALPPVLGRITKIPFWYWMTTLGITGVIWSAYFPRMMKKIYTKQIRKVLREQKSYFIGKKILELKEDGIFTKGDDGESLVNYASISKLREKDGTIYLYNSPVSAIIIPARTFASAEEREGFLAQIRPRLQTVEEKPAPSIFSALDRL
ncbi:MAG: YcxB family protein [Peptostreptococcaceae bacterium]|nr:YcxB family protein [Peptostreptococcaceae bacterium]